MRAHTATHTATHTQPHTHSHTQPHTQPHTATHTRTSRSTLSAACDCTRNLNARTTVTRVAALWLEVMTSHREGTTSCGCSCPRKPALQPTPPTSGQHRWSRLIAARGAAVLLALTQALGQHVAGAAVFDTCMGYQNPQQLCRPRCLPHALRVACCKLKQVLPWRWGCQGVDSRAHHPHTPPRYLGNAQGRDEFTICVQPLKQPGHTVATIPSNHTAWSDTASGECVAHRMAATTQTCTHPVLWPLTRARWQHRRQVRVEPGPSTCLGGQARGPAQQRSTWSAIRSAGHTPHRLRRQ